MTDASDTGTYRDPCPSCGKRMLGVSRDEFINHLREEHGDTMADIWDTLVVP